MWLAGSGERRRAAGGGFVPEDPDDDMLEVNWQKLAAELEAGGPIDRRASGDEGTAAQATRRLKLVVKNALDAARSTRGKKRR
jgi:hypothetical protein